MGFVPNEADFIPSEAGFARTEADFAPSQLSFVRTYVDFVSKKVGLVRSEADLVLSEVDLVPSEVDFVPSEVDFVPSEVDLVPSEVDLVPSEAELVPNEVVVVPHERWKLGPAAHALLARREWGDAASLAREAKHCRIPLKGPRPLAEAISTAGGLRWHELDDGLMVKKIPGLFVAGEMIDWEAPTGGYLLQACFATATRAAMGAASLRVTA